MAVGPQFDIKILVFGREIEAPTFESIGNGSVFFEIPLLIVPAMAIAKPHIIRTQGCIQTPVQVNHAANRSIFAKDPHLIRIIATTGMHLDSMFRGSQAKITVSLQRMDCTGKIELINEITSTPIPTKAKWSTLVIIDISGG